MSSANFNAFGEDPYGIKAHCFAWFYGPAYLPESFDHCACLSGKILPPRYGAPSPQQVPWLPLGWKQTSPPRYYGTPSPPYLPKPAIFDPSIFEPLEKVKKTVLLDLIHCNADGHAEVADGLFSVVVNYWSHGTLRRLTVLTNIRWNDLREKVCARMMIGRDSPLAYRRFYNIAARDEIDDISERDGSVHLLTGPEAWEKAIINLREAGGGIFDVGIEILHADARMVARWNREKGGQSLPLDSLQVKTYFFEYPPVGELLDRLGDVLKVQLVGFEGSARIEEVLQRAGIVNVDDFTMISPRSMHIDDGIPVEAVRLLYLEADEMIRAMHLELESDIRDIEEARATAL